MQIFNLIIFALKSPSIKSIHMKNDGVNFAPWINIKTEYGALEFKSFKSIVVIQV